MTNEKKKCLRVWDLSPLHAQKSSGSRLSLTQFPKIACFRMSRGGHVGGKKQKDFSPLGAKFQFSRQFFKIIIIVLTTNMAAISRG